MVPIPRRNPANITACLASGSAMKLRNAALITSLCLMTSGCGGFDFAEPQVATRIGFRPQSLTFTSAGSFDSFLATVYDANDIPIRGISIRWTTSDISVATVNTNGGVLSVGEGTAMITAEAEGITGTAEVTVTIPQVDVDFTSITAGGSHTCAVTPLEDAYCWGANAYFQLGDGFSLNDSNSPVEVDYNPRMNTVDAGLQHTCSLVDFGTTGNDVVACWGRSDQGQVGQTGPSGVVATPRWIRDDQNTPLQAQSVASGDKHACLVTILGEAYCWASNASGQVGDGTNVRQFDATPVLGGLTFASVAAGSAHSCGLTPAGVAYCWGANDLGQLGDGTNTDSGTPVMVAGGHTFAELSGSCGLTTDGDAYCWGDGAAGQLGNGSNSASNTPVAVLGGLVFETLTSGAAFNCGLTAAGEAHCWGSNASGQLGDGGGSDSNVPVAVSGGHTFQAIDGGVDHACAVTTGRDAYCWGDNSSGQLGDGTNTASATPVRVQG